MRDESEFTIQIDCYKCAITQTFFASFSMVAFQTRERQVVYMHKSFVKDVLQAARQGKLKEYITNTRKLYEVV